MLRKKLGTSLFTIFGRSPPSTLPGFSHHYQFENRSSPIFTLSCSSNEENCTDTSRRNYVCFEKFSIFSRKSYYSSESSEFFGERCWNCDATAATTPFLFCESCRSIQPVDRSVDYFQIFGLEKIYKFDDKNLDGMYKDWQKKLHPDLVHSKSEKEKEFAAEQSARVIDAYRTLQRPLSRAIYMLKLEGIDVNEEQTISDLDLLAEILEIREAVEEAAESQALTKIQSQIQEKLKQSTEYFAKAFEMKNFEEAKSCIQRMTYYERINEEIIKKL